MNAFLANTDVYLKNFLMNAFLANTDVYLKNAFLANTNVYLARRAGHDASGPRYTYLGFNSSLALFVITDDS